MITNTIKKIEDEIIEVPIIIRDDQDGWVPTFDIWSTKIDDDTSYIDCTQNFRSKLKNYATKEIDPRIGFYDKYNDKLVIYWKSLINSRDLKLVNAIYNGKVRACCWQKRYCTYFGTGSKMPWLHSAILGCDEPDMVIHHINGVSVDNRRQNLHILPKIEHDSINHPSLAERKLMFANPKAYWQRRRQIAINEFIIQLSLFFTDEGKNKFITRFAEENKTLVKEILIAAKLYINLNHVKSEISRNRYLNSHLMTNYLDTYEIEKYIKMNIPKNKSTEHQLRLF